MTRKQLIAYSRQVVLVQQTVLPDAESLIDYCTHKYGDYTSFTDDLKELSTIELALFGVTEDEDYNEKQNEGENREYRRDKGVI